MKIYLVSCEFYKEKLYSSQSPVLTQRCKACRMSDMLGEKFHLTFSCIGRFDWELNTFEQWFAQRATLVCKLMIVTPNTCDYCVAWAD